MILVITGLLGYYLSSLLDFIGLQYIDASLERLILYTFPSIVVLISYFVFGQKISRMTWNVLGMTYLGLLLVFLPAMNKIETESTFWLGVFFVFLTAITFACFYIGNQLLIPRLGAIQFTNISMIVACAAVIIHFLVFMPADGNLSTLPKPVFFYAALMALVSTVLPSYMVSYSIKHIGAANSSIISSFGPVATFTLAYFLLGERLSLIQILGGVIIIFSIALLKRFIQNSK